MNAATHPPTIQPDTQRRLDALAPGVFMTGAVTAAVGIVLALVIGFVMGSAQQILLAYLTAFCFYLSISLGAMFFVIVQHLTRAGWSVTIRRLAEVMSMNVVLLAILAIPILVFAGDIYHHWAHFRDHGPDAVLEWKSPWLNLPFFYFRIVLYFALWIFIAWYHWSNSVEQDRTGDRAITHKLQSISGLWTAIVSLLFTFAAFDLIMSLDPHWFSTMFGVYFFGGGFLTFFATLVLICRFLQARGILVKDVTVEHYHDMGKWMLAFVFFWGYIAYSQYMLIWYGSIPEETQWFARRGATTHEPEMGSMAGWGPLSVFLLLGHLFLPFAALLSRWPKRKLIYLTILAGWVFFIHFVDLFWQIMPELNNDGSPFTDVIGPWGMLAVAVPMWIGMGGLYFAGLAKLAAPHALTPVGDPRYREALAFQNY